MKLLYLIMICLMLPVGSFLQKTALPLGPPEKNKKADGQSTEDTMEVISSYFAKY